MVVPKSSYLICANQRSGSTLICRALSDTGVAGHPEEYFLDGPADAFPSGWKFWEEGLIAQQHGGVRDRREYLELVYRVGTTENGVFGAKLMWNNLEWVVKRFGGMDEFAGMSRSEVFQAAFPDLSVVHVVRRDVVRQAVSWARAAQEGVWVVSETEPASPTGEPVYQHELIADLVRLLIEGERGWRQFYDELGVVPFEVVYEELLTEEGYQTNMLGILEHLRLHPGVSIPAPRTVRQADPLNDEWVQRFLSETVELTRPR